MKNTIKTGENMKLKIWGNILRIRLNSKELRDLESAGKIEDQVQHGETPAESMKYSIERGNYNKIEACYSLDRIRVLVPNRLAIQLVKSDLNNIAQSHSEEMHIRIEKDYNCLRGRNDNERDQYPPGTLRAC